jgi:hypothetical protein
MIRYTEEVVLPRLRDALGRISREPAATPTRRALLARPSASVPSIDASTSRASPTT